MYSVVDTLLSQHELALVGLAAAICALSAYAGMTLLERARVKYGRERVIWLAIAATSVGVGIWATHFIAMLAYDPGFAISFALGGTLLSLLIAIVIIGAGFSLACWGTRRSDFVLGGVVVGMGVAAMHYTGMTAMRVGGDVAWDTGLVLWSLLFAGVLAGFAVMLGAMGRTATTRLGAAGLLTLGIVSLHFTGMGALDLSNCFALPDAIKANSIWLAGGIAAGSGLILACVFLALSLDTRDRRRDALEVNRQHNLANAAVEGLIIVHGDRIEDANSAFADMVAHDMKDLAGRPIGDFLREQDLQAARDQQGSFVETHLPLGELMPIELVSRQVVLVGGDREVLIVRDITRRRAREDQYRCALASIAESEKRYRYLIKSVTDYAIYMLDPDGLVVNWNAGAARAKGYSAEEIVGQHFSRFFSDEDRAAGKPARALQLALQAGTHADEGWRYRKDGSRFWAIVMLEPIFDDNRVHLGFVKITRDITRQHEDAERIASATRNLELSLAHMSQGLALFGPDERIVIANDRLNEILGIPANLSITGLGLHDLAKFLMTDTAADPGDIDAIYALHKRLLDGQDRGEIVQEFPGDRTIHIVHRQAGGGSWVTTFEDISERRRSEEQIYHMARHDGLTGLPNRSNFSDSLRAALQGAQGRSVAVLGIDLDRFKEVNDQLGHSVGDTVLKMYADRVTRGIGAGEFASRFGGDEFAAFKVFAQPSELDDFLARVQSAVTQPFSVSGAQEVSIGSSNGVAIFPKDASSAEKLIGNADMAMYRAKQSLVERVCFYEPDMDEAARDRRLLARDLWDAVAKNELSIKYQVQKSVSSGATVGYEALLRWHHPERGQVSPMDFIPVAEECGAILSIGEWVLNAACADAASWGGHIKIAVNISPVQLGSSNLVDIVAQALATSGLSPACLELEVTETAIIGDKQRALLTLKKIKALGVTVAIDDFGTGYSSLETLRAFPFDKIKLDKSFMSEVETSKQAKAMVRAILALGRGLDVPVLAEGVETADQLRFLSSEGCDEAQGFLLGRPETLLAQAFERPRRDGAETLDASTRPRLVS